MFTHADLPPVVPQAAVVKPYSRREIAFVDIETTGLNPARHEILEVAVLRVDARTMKPVAETTVLVSPERLHDAQPEALHVCGFSPALWASAVPLVDALAEIAPLLEGAIIAGHNVAFDWSFLVAGFRRVGLPLPDVDYHRLDTASLAWPLYGDGELTSLSLDAIARYLDVDRRWPHEALDDVRCTAEVARRLIARMRRGGDSRPMRNVGSDQHTPAPSYEELLTGLHELTSALARRRREQGRRRRVYVCHPFADAPERNIASVRVISRQLMSAGLLPIAPHLYLPQFVNEATERERALQLCLELLDGCDELRVFGDRVSPGMQRELDHARRHGIPVRFEKAVLA